MGRKDEYQYDYLDDCPDRIPYMDIKIPEEYGALLSGMG